MARLFFACLAASFLASSAQSLPLFSSGVSAWPRGGVRSCGTLRTPGASFGGRHDETDHCFPADAADHYVCCVDIQNAANSKNSKDSTVARHNPLEGPIRRNSDASSYSWCVCSVSICINQLNGTVAWVGAPGNT